MACLKFPLCEVIGKLIDNELMLGSLWDLRIVSILVNSALEMGKLIAGCYIY